ncbi:hypothetical protein EYF80_044442 [Liparis tanakae]|uniref:Uncharacterized protein n=1 Tax=Liparis tanakae TaxID=230148 RepID=A0A4Z2FVW2_9TELE|nr:hypothetical protein EYF80_044442 [Liparis tanakae]
MDTPTKLQTRPQSHIFIFSSPRSNSSGHFNRFVAVVEKAFKRVNLRPRLPDPPERPADVSPAYRVEAGATSGPRLQFLECQ